MPEYFTTKDFATPVECLAEELEYIQELYDEEGIEDKENAERLIDLYKSAIESLNATGEME